MKMNFGRWHLRFWGNVAKISTSVLIYYKYTIHNPYHVLSLATSPIERFNFGSILLTNNIQLVFPLPLQI